MTACIVGWAHTPFGKLAGETVESLIVRVAGEALADAGIAAKDVDEIVLGHFNAGFSAQDFTASLVLQASPDLRFKRATRVENACATGSAAVHQGLKSIAARSARIVLVVGVEQMTTTPAAEIGRNLLKASYVREEADIDGGFAGIFGKIAGALFPALGRPVGCAGAHRREEPQERRRQSLRANPQGSRLRVLPHREREESARRRSAQAHRLFAGFRRRGGAGAGRRRDRAQALNKAIVFRAAEHVQDFLPMSRRDMLKFEGCAVAWQRALAQAGIALKDLSFAEVHDCFTIAELIEYEAMGLAPEGQGARVIADGIVAKDGALPINPSGGLKAKGHPIGATGVSMHALAAMQLTGKAGDMQIKDAKLGGIFNMGGAAVANYVSILERLR